MVKERVNGCKPAVAGADAVTALVFQVIQKGKHHLSIEILDSQLAGTFLGLLGSKGQEKAQSIPVAVHRCRASPSLSNQMLDLQWECRL